MMSSHIGRISVLTVLVTGVFSILLTLGVVAVIIAQYGVVEVAQEVSPFVETARNRVTQGIVPPSERVEPKTEADAIMDSVAQNQGSSVLIYKSGSTSTPEEYVGRGIVVTSNGYVVTDAGLLSASSTYRVAVPGTKEKFDATVVRTDDGIALLKITVSTTLVARLMDETPVVNDLVVAISGDAKMQIGTGIVTKVDEREIVTNIYGTMTPGASLASKDGYTVGMSTIGNQKVGEASFRVLTKAYVDSMTASVDRESIQTVIE